jgi:hypothetical protein
MAHTSTVLADFQRGETRMIFARRRDRTPGLHFLADGAAEAERKWTWAELLCPVEDCPTPAFTTVNEGDRKRDHYRHKKGNYQHSQESLFHLEGKAQIARWVASRYPDAVVVIEQASNKERERIADVMVTLATGERIAIEIQYAAITPSAWQERHDSYAAQGITDVWLFGHTGAQLNEYRPGTVRLNPTHEAVAASDLPVLWFNPLELLIGHATRQVSLRGPTLDVLATERSGSFHASPLDSFTLTHAAGLTNDTVTQLLADSRRYDLWYDQEQRILARQALTHAQSENERLVAETARRARQRTEYLGSDEAVGIRARHGGLWPAFLNVSNDDVGVAHEVWQGRLFTTLIEPAPGGTLMARDYATAALNEMFTLDVSRAEGANVMIRWFEQLAIAGFLRKNSRQVTAKVRQVSFFIPTQADHDREAQERVRRAEHEEWARGVRAERDAAPRYVGGRLLSDSPPPAPRIPPTGFTCSGCGGPLAQIYSEIGRHHGCTPGSRRSEGTRPLF